jgi:hypothetical protein
MLLFKPLEASVGLGRHHGAKAGHPRFRLLSHLGCAQVVYPRYTQRVWNTTQPAE